MKRLIAFTIGIYLIVVALYAQQILSPDTVMGRLLAQARLFPQENIYVQTDKSDYVAGDTLWFRAYLVNAISRKQESLSRYVYAELIDAQADTIVCRVKAHKDSLNMIHAYIALPPSLSKGTYRFRAYTRYAYNWGEDSFFNKTLRIYATRPSEEPQSPSPNTTDYQVDFFPEGGQAIGGQLCRIAFKAQNERGNGEEIQGALTDENGDTLTRFNCLHNGMGEFAFIPLSGRQYVAWCVNKQGKQKRFHLPQAISHAAALKVTMHQEQYHVSVVHDSLFATDSLQLMVLQRGHPRFARRWDSRTTHMLFSKQAFEDGIVHFLLLTDKGKILSERLVFVYHPNANLPTLTTNQTKYIPRQRVEAVIEWKENENQLLNGNCSVSITDATHVPLDETTHILSTLLLTADLTGTIEAPGWYFGATNAKEKSLALDMLMRIHGWRRYNLQAAIDGHHTPPSHLPETSMQLSGDVKTPFGKPVDQSNVQIYAQGTVWMTQTQTDSKGRFSLNGFEFPESVKYLVTALSQHGKKNVVLRMDAEKYPPIPPMPDATFYEDAPEQERTPIDEAEYIRKSIQNIGHDEAMSHYLLGEVKITSRTKRNYQSEFERDANITLKEERIRQSGLPNLKSILMLLAGVNLQGTSLEENAFVLDGIRVEKASSPFHKSSAIDWLLQTFNVDDIGQIDIIKGAAVVGYFQGKQERVIAITTKRGRSQDNARYPSTNTAVWELLGYQRPIERYTPRYDQPSTHFDRPDMRTTLYWKPDVTIKNGRAQFSFYTADSPSHYNVVIEGISTEGKIFRKVQKLY